MQLNERLRALAAESLDLPLAQIRPDTARADTEAWDSLAHLRLITALESELSCTFTMDEITGFQTLDDVQQLIESRSQHRLDA